MSVSLSLSLSIYIYIYIYIYGGTGKKSDSMKMYRDNKIKIAHPPKKSIFSG